jgi:hypothetical protein
MSPAQERHRREKRYLTMMSFRAACLILATVLYSAHVGLAWLWMPVLLVGMLVLPWLAVIIANGRTRPERTGYHPQAPGERGRPELTGAAEPAPGPRIIDADPE